METRELKRVKWGIEEIDRAEPAEELSSGVNRRAPL
jgi:hypothetical protein